MPNSSSKIILAMLFIMIFLKSLFAEKNVLNEHFLSYGPGVAASGMGNTFIANGNDMSVVYYNPALLSRLQSSEISANHWVLYEGARYNYVGMAFVGERSTFALAGTQLYVGNIEGRVAIEDEASMFSNTQMAIYGAYSSFVKILKMNCGISTKYITYNINNINATGYGLDLGILKNVYKSPNGIILNFGIVGQNLIQKAIKMKDDEEKLPLVWKFGFSSKIPVFQKYNKKKDMLYSDNITFAIDVKTIKDLTEYSLGTQYSFNDKFCLRGGINKGIMGGCGFLFDDFSIDYSFEKKDFVNLHKMGFTYKFSKKNTEAESKKTQSKNLTDDFQEIYQKADRIYNRYYEQALELSKNNKYDEAIKILIKIKPLKPIKDENIEQLLNNCTYALITNNTNKYINNARAMFNKKNSTGAYTECLKAIDSSQDENIKTTLGQIYFEPKFLDEKQKLKERFLKEIELEISLALENKTFNKAESKLETIKIIDNFKATEIKQNIVKTKKEYLAECIKKGMENIKQNNNIEAYNYFVEAEKLNPDDENINFQKRLAKEKYLKQKKFQTQEYIYSDKLYYLTAISFANDDNDVLNNYNELINFNPVCDNLQILKQQLKEAKILN